MLPMFTHTHTRALAFAHIVKCALCGEKPNTSASIKCSA